MSFLRNLLTALLRAADERAVLDAQERREKRLRDDMELRAGLRREAVEFHNAEAARAYGLRHLRVVR